MKGSLRFMFSLLVLVAIATFLTCRTAVVRRAIGSFSTTETTSVRPVFDSTLLKFAAIDLEEARMIQETKQLLEDKNYVGSQGRSISSSQPEHGHVEKSSTRSSFERIPSPEYYRNWIEFRRILRDWLKNKMFQPEIMSQLVNLVKRPLDQHYGLPPQSNSTRYSSCAVVGNSGILLNTEHGSLIDSHEFVIRLNNAWINGYQKFVGSKTSISFVNSNIVHLCVTIRNDCFCHPYGERVPIVMYLCQAIHLMDYSICSSSHKAAPLLITDPRFDILCSRIVKYYSLKGFIEETGKSLEEWNHAHDGIMFHYSSGMQAVMLALGVCDKVSIFGFGKSNVAKHHYHTNQKVELHLHDYEAEYRFYHDLVERPEVIPFLVDSFKIPPVVIYH